MHEAPRVGGHLVLWTSHRREKPVCFPKRKLGSGEIKCKRELPGSGSIKTLNFVQFYFSK